MLADLEAAPQGSIILLHACAHNPTGCDPNDSQWAQLLSVIQEKGHLIFFDSAYQGFASGDAEADAKALRRVVSVGSIPVILAQSFAKNFGLYGERCGTLSVVCRDAAQKDILMSQLRCIIRPMYSSPPKHGSSIVRTVLSDPKLTEQYYEECAGMAERIQSMRNRLVEALVAAGSKHDWSHVTEQIGMFAYTGMSAAMCDKLTNDYAIYLTRDGRISIAGT
jgi:aspartate aminotransferase